MDAELPLTVAPYRSRPEICFSHVEPHAEIFDHRDCGHGFVPGRCHVAFHRCAFGAAAAAAFSRPRAAGDGVRTLPRRGIKLPPCCAGRLLRLALEDPRL